MANSIKDEVYFLLTTKELKEKATSMGVTFKDIPENTSFKKRLWLRIKGK